jgi:hypothetical protein
MRSVGALAAGVGAGAVAQLGARPVLRSERLRRTNARGRDVATAAGVGPLAVAVLAAARPGPLRAAAVGGAVLGVAGLVDDVAGDRRGDVGTRGLAGHLGALRRGRVTTGIVKVGAGVVGGLGASALVRAASPMTVVDGAVVALSANLGNLLDRAPGRTAKAAVAVTVGLAVCGRLDPGTALLVGATLAGLPDELADRTMLGDTGANLVGAAVGVGLVAGLGPGGRVVALAALGGLTLASERWSFSAVIDANPVLRAVDRIGRLPT